MAGHSKWAQIKRQKGINDTKKGNTFAKLSRMITLSVLEGGGPDPALNVKLRLALEKAKYENMPKETIERAVEKGSGPSQESLQEIVYEAFGPGGTVMLIKAATDNPNRAIGFIRNVLDRNGGKIGSLGSVGYLFEKTGTVAFTRTSNAMDQVLLFSDSIGANDILETETEIIVYFPFEQLGKIKDSIPPELHQQGTAEEEYRPLNPVLLSQSDKDAVITLMQALEELDDVQEVFTNAQL